MVFTYKCYIEDGRQALYLGQFRVANTKFGFASCAAKNEDDKASALQMKGIALRRDKQYQVAESTLREAAHTANNEVLKAQILRSLGMVQFDQAILKKDAVLLDDALKSFDQSYRALLRVGATTEAAVSHGFRGRAYLKRGRRMRVHAREILADAHLMLSNQDNTYELNNLLWLMRASSTKARLHYFGRARELIKLTHQTKRRKELLVIMAGG